MSRDQNTREFLQGYAAALGDLGRMGGNAPLIMKMLEGTGMDYHAMRDAGVEAYDLGEIAKARDAMKRLGPRRRA